MKFNSFARIFVLCVLACGVYAVAQDSPLTNITGGGAKGRIPVYTGAHKIGNSNIVQDGSGNEDFGAGINANGVISGASDVDAGGNLNANGFVDAQGEVYSASEIATGGGYFGSFIDVDAPSGEAIYAYANDGSQVVQGLQYDSSGGYEFAFFNYASSAVFYGDIYGDTVAVGSKSAAVPLKNGQMVKVYSQESPQVWFEDFGGAKLVGGVATVKLDSKFAQLVNTKLPYRVFVTPNGDCHGLYVAQKGRNSFEVREIGGGNSNVEFDYRISALRKGYETVRLAPAVMPTVSKPPARPAALKH
jgi:hypothetical protein